MKLINKLKYALNQMILKVDGTLPPEKKRRDLMVEPNIQIFQASLTWKQEIIESLIHIFWLNKWRNAMKLNGD